MRRVYPTPAQRWLASVRCAAETLVPFGSVHTAGVRQMETNRVTSSKAAAGERKKSEKLKEEKDREVMNTHGISSV